MSAVRRRQPARPHRAAVARTGGSRPRSRPPREHHPRQQANAQQQDRFADLVAAPRDHVRDDPIKSERGEQGCQKSESSRERGHRLFGQHGLFQLVRERPELDSDRGTHRPDGSLRAIHQWPERSGCAEHERGVRAGMLILRNGEVSNRSEILTQFRAF